MSAPSQAISEANSRGPGGLPFHAIPSLYITGENISPLDDYRRAYPLWRILRDCYAGELTIKQAGERYLRRPANVEQKDYATYLSRAYFYNATRRTHTGLLGSMMRKNPEVTLPTGLRTNLSAITIDGMSFVEFTRKICHEDLLVGRFGILTDIPSDTPLGQAPDPYLAGYRAEAIFRPRYTLINGRRVIDRIILLEKEITNTEYSRTERDMYRILRLDPDADGKLVYSQTLIRPSLSNSDSVESVTQREIRIQGRQLDYIPFVFINTTNLLPEIEDPNLIDIATLNLSHYESTALLEHGRFYAGMPTYWTADGDEATGNGDLLDGMGTPNPMSVGPSNVWLLGKGGKAGLLEFNGHGLSFLENAVDSKQLQMQSLGGKFIPAQQKSAALSTEAYGLMEAGDEASLLSVALTVERALKISLDYMNDMQNNLPANNGLVELNKEFVRSEMTAREISALRALYESRMIPLDVMYYSLRQIGVIPMEYTLADFKVLMETPSQLYADPTVQPIPGGPIYNPADPTDPRNKPVSKPPANNGE
jgi:hypothetical protein